MEEPRALGGRGNLKVAPAIVVACYSRVTCPSLNWGDERPMEQRPLTLLVHSRGPTVHSPCRQLSNFFSFLVFPENLSAPGILLFLGALREDPPVLVRYLGVSFAE